MGRVTYLHHYFPALYFSILMVPLLMDHFTRNCTDKTRWIVFIPIYCAVIITFIRFAPVAFGMEGPISQYKSLQWRKSWNIVDN
jgi:dolichyl-phosphate-mannose-protein mannosyltransferase